MMQLDRSVRSPRPSVSLAGDFVALATIVLSTILMIAVVSILYFLREIFIPLSLAILLSFVLAPGMRLLQRLRCPRALAAIFIVLVAFGVISGLGTILATGVRDLAKDLPGYQTVLREKIQTVKGMRAGSQTLDRAAGILQDLGKELQSTNRPSPDTLAKDTTAQQQQQPVPVVIREAETGPFATVSALIAPLLNPLAMTGVIIVFVIFILVKREDLRDRLIRLTGTRDLGRTTAAIDDAAHRLSRFYLVQVALNSGFGLCVGIGLWIIGVPSPAIWGILAAVLRFVPYVGSVISAVLPLALAAAVEPGWTKVFETLALFGVVDLLVSQVIEPLLYGHSTGLSPVAIVVAATFWTWLWGPIGLILATPLTVCLVVLGRHVERLRFLEVLFGDRPALSPPEIFYQRMLAADPAEAADHAEQFLKKRSLLSYYGGVAMEGLRLAQADISAGLLDAEQTATIVTSAMEVVEDLDAIDDLRPSGGLVSIDSETQAAVDASTEAEIPPLPVLGTDDRRADWGDGAVVCIAGASELDEVGGRILAQVLGKHGLPAGSLPPNALRSADLFRLDLSGARWICLSFMDMTSHAHVRHAVKKLRRKAPGASVVVGAWSASPEEIGSIGADADGIVIVRSLYDAARSALDAASNLEARDGKAAVAQLASRVAEASKEQPELRTAS